MTGEKLDEKAIFNVARNIDSRAERAKYLDQACGGDGNLIERIETLLRGYEEQASFLESPAADLTPTTDLPPIAEHAGTVIGPYKLLQQIGEGGMGVVFMAEQERPFQRTVALKIIKPGMDTRQVIARFEAERQALAMMDHPNIAKVLDAGTTGGEAEGLGLGAGEQTSSPQSPAPRPFFVMELVKGVPITKYCDEKQLSLRERLELFKPVCEAVQHAHQKGIIHRDLKPTNVLVAEYDNRPVPKVIDFGVAKATAQKLTERTMFTEFGQVIGTVEYMSPEQAKFNQLDIDTRSDIYSLGVLLYELLTGSTPFDRERLRTAAFDEVLRIIREEEPPKPSTRLSQIARPSWPGSPRISRPSRPGSSPDPNPAGTAGLYDSTAIAANRHTEPARLNKDLRGELDWIVMKCLEKDRNRRYETANGLGRDIERFLHDEPVHACPPSAPYRFRKFARRNKVALFVASAAMTILLLAVTGLAISNRLIAVQRAQAEAERNQKAEALFQKEIALKQAEAERKRAEEGFVKARIAIRDIMVDAPAGRGDWSNIHPSLRANLAEKAVQFYQRLIQEQSADPSLKYETAVAYRSLALLHNGLNQFQQAEKFARQSISILERLSVEYPEVMDYRHQLAYSHYVLGAALKNSKRAVEAEAPFKRAVDLYEELISQRPEDAAYLSELPHCYAFLALLKTRRGASEDAEHCIKRLVDLVEKVPAASAKQSDIRANFALAFYNARRLDESITVCRETIRQKPDDSAAYFDLGRALGEAGRLEESIDAYKECIHLQPDRAGAFANMGFVLQQKGDLDEALAAYRKAIELQPSRDGAYLGISEILCAQGKFDEAEAVARKAIALFPDNSETYASFVTVLTELGKLDEAKSVCQKALDVHPEDSDLFNQLAWILSSAPDPKHRDMAQAMELATKAVELSPQNGTFWNTLGIVRYRLGQWQPAVDALTKSINVRNGGDAFDWFFLAMAHWQLGHKDEARNWFDKAVEWMDQNQSKKGELIRVRAEAADLLGTSTTNG